jgi:hypothetical protein
LTDLGIFAALFGSPRRSRKPLRNKGISRDGLIGRRGVALSTSGDRKFAGHEFGSPSETRNNDPLVNRVTHCVMQLPLVGPLGRGAKPSASEQKERGIESRGGGVHRGDKTKGGIEVVASDGDVLELAGAAGCLFPTPKLQPGALAAPVG